LNKIFRRLVKRVHFCSRSDLSKQFKGTAVALRSLYR